MEEIIESNSSEQKSETKQERGKSDEKVKVTTTTNGDGNSQVVTCERCGHSWPCKSKAIRPTCPSCNRKVKKAREIV